MKAKKKSIVALASSAVLLCAAAALVLLTLLRPGASSPELAVQHYEEACMLYDVNDMVRYSSDYNRYILYRSRTPESTGELKRYLKEDVYKDIKSGYSESEIDIRFSESVRIEPGSEEFETLRAEYAAVADASDIGAFAELKLTIYVDGERRVTRTDYAVQVGSRWYYFK